MPTSMLCPYDASGLAAAVLADARHTHPRVIEDGARRPSAEYSGTAVAWAIGGTRLHSGLGYRTPQEVLDECLNGQEAA